MPVSDLKPELCWCRTCNTELLNRSSKCKAVFMCHSVFLICLFFFSSVTGAQRQMTASLTTTATQTQEALVNITCVTPFLSVIVRLDYIAKKYIHICRKREMYRRQICHVYIYEVDLCTLNQLKRVLFINL